MVVLDSHWVAIFGLTQDYLSCKLARTLSHCHGIGFKNHTDRPCSPPIVDMIGMHVYSGVYILVCSSEKCICGVAVSSSSVEQVGEKHSGRQNFNRNPTGI